MSSDETSANQDDVVLFFQKIKFALPVIDELCVNIGVLPWTLCAFNLVYPHGQIIVVAESLYHNLSSAIINFLVKIASLQAIKDSLQDMTVFSDKLDLISDDATIIKAYDQILAAFLPRAGLDDDSFGGFLTFVFALVQEFVAEVRRVVTE
jgi:hypothetical protein